MNDRLAMKSGLLSLLFFMIVVMIWQAATAPVKAPATVPDDTSAEYAYLMGKGPHADADVVKGFPTPAQFLQVARRNLASPFHDHGPNDKGIGIQLAYSLGRVALGYVLAILVAIPLGFLIGMSPVLYRALDPFIQLLRPISPLAWMPIALYTIKDSTISSIFVIFICSLWPMLVNTAFGVAGVRKDWLNVARTLEVSPLRKAFLVILPASAPAIITGMRISMGIAWLVIIAAEMLIGGTGIGYFLWNEWNNLSIANVLFAVAMIGIVGMLLDRAFGLLLKKVTYAQ